MNDYLFWFDFSDLHQTIYLFWFDFSDLHQIIYSFWFIIIWHYSTFLGESCEIICYASLRFISFCWTMDVNHLFFWLVLISFRVQTLFKLIRKITIYPSLMKTNSKCTRKTAVFLFTWSTPPKVVKLTNSNLFNFLCVGLINCTLMFQT